MKSSISSSTDFLVVIPTAGRTDSLATCLRSLAKILPLNRNFNALVVDNNLDPGISTYIRTKVSDFPEISYMRCESPGLTAARHSALHASHESILCFVDDDVIFTEAWLRSTASIFSDSSVAVAGGPTIPSFQSGVPSWFWDFIVPTPYGGWCCTWLSLLDIGNDIDNINPNWIWGLNFSIRRDALIDCGGFHIDLVPKQYQRWQGDGETGLTKKIAEKCYRAAYRQESLLFHQCGQDRLNSNYFAKRAYYQGVCNSFTELRSKLRNNTTNPPENVESAGLICRAFNKAKTILTFKQHTKEVDSETITSSWAGVTSEIKVICAQAEREGYLFHQKEASEDALLQTWISRDNYLDVDLRTLLAAHNHHQSSKGSAK